MPHPILQPGDIHVWRIHLDDAAYPWLSPLPEESERAARFRFPELGPRYLRAHAALRDILSYYTRAELLFAEAEHRKPYLPGVPQLQFNLSHSHERALVAVALNVEVGVDVEKVRPMPDCISVAERFFPPEDAAALAQIPVSDREREFFRYWTRIEAMLKARGVGLYGAGSALEGAWTVEPIEAGEPYFAAVAAPYPGMQVTTYPFGV